MSLLEARPNPSSRMRLLSPLIAIALTLITGYILFAALGKNPLVAFKVFFIDPLLTGYGWSELLVKASPLIIIAEGLAIGFRARIYNIGAEGQLIVGAIFGGGVAIACEGLTGFWILPLMVLAGALGGGLWGALAAWLKTRFRAEETLTTLMLTYVASYLLSYLVNGPWRDPQGMNFPQSIMFTDGSLFTLLIEGLRINTSVFITAFAVIAFWIFVSRSFLAYQLAVGGQAPAAARYAGFSSNGTIWFSLTLSGVMAGIAGVGEVAGPVGQLNLNISPGYGFAAIIVAYVGRLDALGIVLSGFLMALLYIGGEAAQVALQLPSAITGLFQGMLLFFLLGTDVFVDYRLKRRVKLVAQTATPRSSGVMIEHLIPILAGTMGAAVPLIFAGLGELVAERSGVINLGVEGMMLIGAIAGFACAVETGMGPFAGLAAGAVAGALAALIFGVLTLSLIANQAAAGLALTIFGIGLSSFIGQHYVSFSLPGLKPYAVPLLSDIPVLGVIFFKQDPIVYLSWLAFVIVAWVMAKTRLGLLLRAIGESPEAAHSLGYRVIALRYGAVLFGGAMAGIGGAYLLTVYTPLWVQEMTAGRGWIAVALVVFATWKPERLMLGAYLFGGVTILQFHAQGLGIAVPSQFLSALPYAATIVVLVIISRDRRLLQLNLPASLGKPFLAGS